MDESRRVAQISRVAEGGAVLSRHVVEKLDKDGLVVERQTREQYAAPEWTANAFLLERRDPKRWGRRMAIDPKADQPATPATPPPPSVIIYIPDDGRAGPAPCIPPSPCWGSR